MSKTTAKANRRSALITGLIASASDLGYAFSGGFEAACEAARKLVPSDYLSRDAEGRKPFGPAIQDFGERFKAGHLVRYLEARGYAKRWGNLDSAQRIESAIEIMGKAEPTSDKSNRRTELEHNGVKAAQNAWTNVRGHANLKDAPKPRAKGDGANKRKAAGDEKPVPSTVLTPPKFGAASTPVDVVSFWDKLSADLLNKAVNGNAAVTPIGIKTAVQDFRKAVRAAVAAAKAGETRTRKAKATKGTVSAATIASRMQNGAKPNGASVQ